MALREFLKNLERNGELHRTSIEIDPALELTEVSTRALREGKPALLIEHPGGSSFPTVVNQYASARRIELALGRHPDEIGGQLIGFLEKAFPPTLPFLLSNRKMLGRFMRSRPTNSGSALSQEVSSDLRLDALPIQVCWPGDGGKFITYGQVITYDPRDGKRNIGIYRMHVFDESTTGMHWQIQKGGGFHYFQAEQSGRNFELAVALGTSPALLLATVAALPEGIDEAMFAGFLQNERIAFARGKSITINVPSDAEFVLEGHVPAKERRMEGPFGDHFGHYSAAAEFPVFHLTKITHRKNPADPAIVVGKPPMEDKFLGDATQQILGPLAKLIHKEVTALWAYYEAGFHNLLAVAVEQRYQKEAMKAALGLMGTDQLSLTKCMVMVSSGVDVRDFHAVMREVREQFDPHFDFVMIPKVPLDTLDFTSYKMNLGSKMILDATRKPGRGPSNISGDPGTQASLTTYAAGVKTQIGNLVAFDRRILEANLVDEALLLVRVDAPLTAPASLSPAFEPADRTKLLQRLVALPEFSSLKIIALVSPDVDIHNRESYIWGVFTRFDCERDVIFTENRLSGISPIYRGVMGIDVDGNPATPSRSPCPMKSSGKSMKSGKIWNE